MKKLFLTICSISILGSIQASPINIVKINNKTGTEIDLIAADNNQRPTTLGQLSRRAGEVRVRVPSNAKWLHFVNPSNLLNSPFMEVEDGKTYTLTSKQYFIDVDIS